GSRMRERGLQALPLAGAEPVQRHREVVHPDLRHDDLLTGCFSDRGRLPRPATSQDDPLARSHRQRLAAEHHTCGITGAFLRTVRNRPWTQIRHASPPFGAAVTVHLVTVVVTPNWDFCAACNWQGV